MLFSKLNMYFVLAPCWIYELHRWTAPLYVYQIMLNERTNELTNAKTDMFLDVDEIVKIT